MHVLKQPAIKFGNFTNAFICLLQTDYLALADQLSQYVVKLLDKVRGHDELEILLNKTGRASEEESYELLDRLKLAIQYNEKKVRSVTSMQKPIYLSIYLST